MDSVTSYYQHDVYLRAEKRTKLFQDYTFSRSTVEYTGPQTYVVENTTHYVRRIRTYNVSKLSVWFTEQF